MLRRYICIIVCFLLLTCAMVAAKDFPAVSPPVDESAYGQYFQRTMSLLATSTPEQPNTVRILYYGQSIVGQRWSDAVDENLRLRFPHANLITKNLAIGGFSSDRLVRTMEYDVFPFYPDLVVFHVYGSHVHYEEIIRAIRSRTTAEVIMQTDHITEWPDPVAANLDEQNQWNDKMSNFFLPEFAKRYGCALQPQREEWTQYLKNHSLQPKDLLSDDVHLNDHGKWLAAELLSRFMVYLPQESDEAWRSLVTTYRVGRDIHWKDGRLMLEFDGNRVVALAGNGDGTAKVLIDEKSPSEFSECYTFTRPSETAGVGWPALMQIDCHQPLLVEEWTATFCNFNADQTDFEFDIEGSVTGPDGSGRAIDPFVSDSERIVISPGDWVFDYCKKVSGKPTPDGWKVRWRVEPLFIDEYATPTDGGYSMPQQVVLASNLVDGIHHLELVEVGDSVSSIKAIQVYRPPLFYDKMNDNSDNESETRISTNANL